MIARTALVAGLTALGALAPTVAAHAGADVPSAVTSDDCTSNYHAGFLSIDMTIRNGTNKTLTLVPDLTGHIGTGHWANQPLPTLAPGQCENINGYTDNPFAMYLEATYTLPDGSYVPFDEATNGVTPRGNGQVFTGRPSGGVSGPENLIGVSSTVWKIADSDVRGRFHPPPTLTGQPRS
jgi:hypothetical protein